MIDPMGTPEALAGIWDAAVLGPVREINEQVIDALCAAAAADDGAALLAAVRADFLPAPAIARRRLADCPYLLLDAGFGEHARWSRSAGVRDAPPFGAAGPPVLDCGTAIARRVLMFGWHLARANRLAACVALGMTPECAELVGLLPLRELEAIAETDRGWVRLRWENRAELWRPMLRAALLARTDTLAGLQMRGLQLLAAERLGTIARDLG